MNPLQRALIEKTGHDNGFEHVLSSAGDAVILASARHRSQAVVTASADGFGLRLQPATPALLPELFPANVRYTGSGISYNVSSILGAAVAPFIAVALWSYGGGSPFWVGVYLSIMGVLTLIALLAGKETKDVDINH